MTMGNYESLVAHCFYYTIAYATTIDHRLNTFNYVFISG